MQNNSHFSKQPLPIACIIMASGASQRFGSNKLLASFHGRPLLENILLTTNQIPFLERLVVTRTAEAADICHKQQVSVLLHDEPGQNDTVRLAIGRLKDYKPAGYLFCVADQPLISAASLFKLCQAFLAAPQYIYRTSYNDIPGNPILFPAAFAAELMQLPQDKGGSYLLKKYPERVRYVPAQDAYELYDIDTPEDLQHLELLTPSAEQY